MNLCLSLIVSVLYFLFALVVLLSIVFNKPLIVVLHENIQSNGDEGEMVVARELEEIADERQGYLFNHICFIDREGYSCEIDHILLTRGGMFVIETKNISGYIRGGPSSKTWKSYAGKNVVLFKNPLLQNNAHINHLRKALGNYLPRMMPLVVFPNKNSKSKRVQNNMLYDLDSMKRKIDEISRVYRYSKDEIEFYKSRIDYLLLYFGISKEEHVDNIKRLYQEVVEERKEENKYATFCHCGYAFWPQQHYWL